MSHTRIVAEGDVLRVSHILNFELYYEIPLYMKTTYKVSFEFSRQKLLI